MNLDDFQRKIFKLIAGEIKDIENILHLKNSHRDSHKITINLCDGIIAWGLSLRFFFYIGLCMKGSGTEVGFALNTMALNCFRDKISVGVESVMGNIVSIGVGY